MGFHSNSTLDRYMTFVVSIVRFLTYCILLLLLFAGTDDLLCTIDFKYSRKKKQSVREHLKSLQKPPYNVIRGGDDTITEVSDMYEHARFETKVLFC